MILTATFPLYETALTFPVNDFSLTLDYAFQHKFMASGSPYIVDDGTIYDRRVSSVTSIDAYLYLGHYYNQNTQALVDFNITDIQLKAGENIFGPDLVLTYPNLIGDDYYTDKIPCVIINSEVTETITEIKSNGFGVTHNNSPLSITFDIQINATPYLTGTSDDPTSLKFKTQSDFLFTFASQNKLIIDGEQDTISKFDMASHRNFDFSETTVSVDFSESDMKKLLDCHRIRRGRPFPWAKTPTGFDIINPYWTTTSGSVSYGVRITKIESVTKISPTRWSADVSFMLPTRTYNPATDI